MHWSSKDKRSASSPKFRWMEEQGANGRRSERHFIPLFVMRKEYAKKLKMYYYVGRVESYANLHATQRHDDGKTISLMTADLRLAKPLSTELYRHLTGQIDA